jgi:hypothetical protein
LKRTVRHGPPGCPRNLAVFLDGVHAHAPPRRVGRLRRQLAGIGIRSTLERPRHGAGQLVCFSLAHVSGLWLTHVVHLLQEHNAPVVRLEFAADPIGADPDRAEAAALAVLRLKGNPSAVPTRKAGQAATYVGTRDDPYAIAIYSDRASKRAPGSGRACHVELRIQRPLEPRALLRFDPAFVVGRQRILAEIQRETTWGNFMEHLPPRRSALWNARLRSGVSPRRVIEKS